LPAVLSSLERVTETLRALETSRPVLALRAQVAFGERLSPIASNGDDPAVLDVDLEPTG
jgi:hypothetical protein